MSPEQQLVESLAVAFVVESSLAVAQSWRQVLLEYVQLLLKRLADTHPNFKLRIAFVSYGTADTLPSPLICKRFFADYSIVAKELKDALTNFGLGQINSGGTSGMAALEGLVATLELFDVLQTQGRDRFTSHVFHIAAFPPDGSIHPSCNESPAMDQVNWETLPLEIKKRNIHYTSISLRTNLSEFSQLHSAAVVGSTTPWFNVRPSHSLLLASFSVPPQEKGIATKRPGEMQTESTPEAKRPRLQTKIESPKVVPQALGTTQPTPPASNPVQLPPSRSSQFPSTAQPPRLTQQNVLEGLRKMEERIQVLELALATAQSERNAQEEENILQELTKNKENHAKFKQFYNNYLAKYMIARQQAQAQSHSQSHHTPNLPQNQGLPAPPFSLNGANKNLSTGGIPANQVQMQHTRSLSNSTFQPPLSDPNPSNANAMTAQMQKANELQTRLIPPQMSLGHNIGLTPQNNSPSGLPDSDPASSSGFSSVSGLGQSSQPELGNAVPVWAGSLNWSGQGPSGKKEVCTYVIATSPNPAACHPDTWPKALSLVPTRELGLSNTDLHIWIKRFRPAVCHLQVQPRGQDSKVNQSNYDSLVQLLREKKLFATAAWTTPSGAQGNNVVVFPVSPRGLVGAFFPINGIPEMPKPSAMPNPMAMNPFNLPPALLSHMQQLTPEQRATMMGQLIHARQQQQQSQQPPNQDGTSINLEMQGHPNTALRAISNPGTHGLNVNVPPGFPRPGTNNALGGVQGNLSYEEMLQSFMRRNGDGGMSMNQQVDRYQV